MIYILNKQQQIISTLSTKGDMNKIVPYFEDIHIEELETGVETFEFKTLSNVEVASDIQVGNYVAFKDENCYKIFQIKEIQEQHGEQIEKIVYCEGACLELLNEVVRPMTINSANLKQFLDTVLDGTSWSIGMIDSSINEVIHLDISEYENVYKLLQETVIDKFGAELRFRVEISNNRIISKCIDVFAKRGRVTKYRFEYGVNMTSVEKVVDTSELATALIGVGKDNLTFKDVESSDKPKNQDFIANQEAYNRWNNNGSHIVGVFNCESESAQELLKLTRDELKRRSEPKITYNLEVELLGAEVSLGDEVFVIDNEFTPPLHLSARVSTLEKSKTDKQSNRCTLSNFKEVKSNITSEMRDLANSLQGKLDDKINKKFPVVSDDIDNGAITEGKIESQYLSTIKTDIVLASVVETEKLVANKADIDSLNAVNGKVENLQSTKAEITELQATNATVENLRVNKAEIDSLNALEIKVNTIDASKANITDLNVQNGKIENLQSTKADITELQATNATIENLKANKADIDSLEALEIKVNTIDASKANISDLNAANAIISNLQTNKAEITELNAVKGNIESLTSEVADINTLVNGNLTSDNIHSLVLTSDKVTVQDAFIKNAMIDEIDASKLNAGQVNTGLVTIESPTGGITIANNTQQFKDKNSKVRVQIGEDKNGDFNFSIYDETGIGVLIDHTGVKEGALSDDIIKSNMIGSDSVGEKQINYNSFATGFNKDTNTNTLKATKVKLDNTNQTLEVGFNSLKTQADDTKSKTESNSTKLEVQQGQIQGLISDTTIEKDGESIKIKDAYSEMEQTVDSFGVTIGEHTTNISQIGSKADNALNKASDAQSSVNGISGRVTEVESAQSSLQQDVGGISSKVSHLESTTETLDNKVNAHESRLSSAEQQITSEAIISTVTSTIDKKVTEGVDSIQIGGRNLLLDSSDDLREVTFNGWDYYFPNNLVNWEKGDKLTGRIYLKPTNQNVSCMLHVRYNDSTYLQYRGTKINAGSEGYSTVTITIPNRDDIASINFSIRHDSENTPQDKVYYKEEKVEKGTKWTDWTPAPGDIDSAIKDSESFINGNIDSAIKDVKDDILGNVSDNYTSADSFKELSETVSSNMKQTNKDIEMQFTTAQNYTKEVDGKLQEFQNTVGTHIRFSEDGIDLGKTNSPFTTTLDNTQLAFKQDGNVVAYISNNKMHITQAEIKEVLRIGTSSSGYFTLTQGSKGNLSLKWSDK